MIKVSNRLPTAKERKKYKFIVATHPGIFHPDELIAIAILVLAFGNKLYILRTRNKELLEQADIVVDVGGGKLDHHMKGFRTCRLNGVLYASAGLVWKEYGMLAISNVLMKYKFFVPWKDVEEIFTNIDRRIMEPIDKEDNGLTTKEHMFSFVYAFYPTQKEKEAYNLRFKMAEMVSMKVFERILVTEVAKYDAYLELDRLIKESSLPSGILEIPRQSYPWKHPLIKWNSRRRKNKKILFVIFRYPDGGWAAQCVPPSKKRMNDQIVSFPESWRGRTGKDLEDVSGVKDAILCHNGLFFARAKTKKAIIEMVTKAIEMNG